MLAALIKELALRKNELSEEVETIYFGGGTPSLLATKEIQSILDAIYQNFEVIEHPEITLEANPDDLSETRIWQLAQSPINRLSIGVQSFFEEDLKLMNRAHNAQEARACLEAASTAFDNISIDLIYGIPGMTNKRWKENIETAMTFNPPHISSYALTVEPKTALASFIKKGLIANVDDTLAQEQFEILIEALEAKNFIHYETSNFGKEGFFSKNNSAYWQGKSYLGIGPSAHSFNQKERSWNIRNNVKYMRAIEENNLPRELEKLSKKDRYNEAVMTGLRTVWGVSLEMLRRDFGDDFSAYLLEQAEPYIKDEYLIIENDTLCAHKRAKFLVDGIASNLFMI